MAEAFTIEGRLTIKDDGSMVFDKVAGAAKEAGTKISDAATVATSGWEKAKDTLKSHWMALTAAGVAAWMALSKAMDWARIGAAALQAEESFKAVTLAYGIDANKLLAEMKRVTVGMIDDSSLMQKAVSAIQLGLDPTQIVALLEVARTSARTAGVGIEEAFNRITDAITHQMTRGLKSMGIIIDQTKALKDYADMMGYDVKALTEAQQTQALFNAAIAEGRRQAVAFGEITMSISETFMQTNW